MYSNARRWFHKWSGNAGFWLLLIVMLLVLGVASYTYLGYRQAATELVLERDEQLVVLSAARLREELANLAENLQLLARSHDLASGDFERQREAIDQAVPRLAVFDGGVVLLNERGTVHYTYPRRPELEGIDWSNLSLFQAVFEDSLLYISNGHFDGPQGNRLIMIGVPIQDDGGHFAGALVGMFNLGEQTLSAFYASIVRLRLGQSGTTYIVDGNGRILFDSESDRVGESLTPDQQQLMEGDGEAGAMLTRDERNIQIVAAYAPVPGTSWQLLIEDDWTILTQSTRRFSNILLLSFGVALVLPPLSLAVLSRQRRFKLISELLPPREDHIVRALHRELQPQMLPVLPGWDLFFKHESGDQGGHNFIDAMILPNAHLMMVMGHVDAGGVKGALALNTTRSILRAAGQEMLEPIRALTRGNQLLCTERSEAYAVRCLYMILDPSSGSIQYANAGQPQFFIAGSKIQAEQYDAGSPLGASLEVNFASGEVELAIGESVVILSPGMTEAKNFKKEPFRHKIPEILAREQMDGQAMAENIFLEYERFVDRGGQKGQDLSVLIVRRLPSSSE